MNAIEQETIFRLVYHSRSHLDDEGFEELLEQSRSNNAKRGLSGVLIEKDDVFLQVLEGDEEVVWEVFHKIELDPRHSEVTVVAASHQPERLFRGWDMASMHVNKALFEGFMRCPFRDDGDVQSLLKGFLREGQFR